MKPQLLMRYAIGLPADYDMAIIRTRVRTRGHALDDRAGLGMKAYCIREAGVDGSPVNEYAPFYLWTDAGAAAGFLWGGPGFDGIIRDFGRPPAPTWVPSAVGAGALGRADVTHARLRITTVHPGADLGAVARGLAGRVAARCADPGTHLAVAGIDPVSWQAVEFTTSAGADDPAGSGDDTLYTVLHISQPEQFSRPEPS
jgi:hypothetical protein